jgi:tetratricopeptide (TPR) repeat protein
MSFRLAGGLGLLVVSLAPNVSAQTVPPQEKLLVIYPGKSWGLQIDSPGFVVDLNQRKEDGRQYLMATNRKTGIEVSVSLEQGNAPADDSTCPEYLARRVQSLPVGMKATDVRSSRISDMSVIEYQVPEIQTIPLRQHNLVGCMAKDDVYIDIHLSKVQFKASDEKLFTDLLGTVRIMDISPKNSATSARQPDSPASTDNRTSLQLFMEGSVYFRANDFQKAIDPYQHALELEKQNPKLDRDLWRVLVDNFGMAYGISGDLNHAEEIYVYGLGKDPQYPMFFYNMACVSAERGDMDKTMAFLRKAFAFKANMIQGETMPDPRHDDSFQSFMSNERFRKFVDSLYAPNQSSGLNDLQLDLVSPAKPPHTS